jgi:hypothetical protein
VNMARGRTTLAGQEWPIAGMSLALELGVVVEHRSPCRTVHMIIGVALVGGSAPEVVAHMMDDNRPSEISGLRVEESRHVVVTIPPILGGGNCPPYDTGMGDGGMFVVTKKPLATLDVKFALSRVDRRA